MNLTNKTKPNLKEEIKMKKIQVTHVVTGAVEIMDSRKAVAETFVEKGYLNVSASTAVKKIGEAIREGVEYEGMKFEEIEVNDEVETVATEASDESEVVDDEVVNDETQDEVVEEETKDDEVEDEVKSDEDVNNDEVIEEESKDDEEIKDEGEEQSDENKDENEKPKEEETTSRRKVGKSVEWYENGVLKDTFPSIKACALYMKELLNLKHMPFTPIMKSIRTDVDWNQYSFRFTGQEDVPQPKEDENNTPDPENKVEEVKEEVQEQQEEVIEEIIEEEQTHEEQEV